MDTSRNCQNEPLLTSKRGRAWLGVNLAALILLKILLCWLPSDAIDMAGYLAWSQHLALKDWADFYRTWHVVYGPAYLYLLWISGEIAAAFGVLGTKAHEILIKLWPVLFDCIGGVLIYRIARKQNRQRLGFWLAIGYSLNPAVFFNSAVWGQFESVVTTLMLAALDCLIARRKAVAALLFTLAVLTKPQAAELAPLVFFLFVLDLSWRELGLAAVGSLAVYTAVVMPFSAGRSFFWLIPHFIESGGDYPYTTANAFNLWTLLGGQTLPDATPFWQLSYGGWGVVLLAAVVLLAGGVAWVRRNQPFWLFYAAYLLCFGVFLVGTRMHERYLFPALIFLTVCLIWERRLAWPLIGLSGVHFANTGYVYLRGWLERDPAARWLATAGQWLRAIDPAPVSIWVRPGDPFAHLIAAVTCALFGYSVYWLFQQHVGSVGDRTGLSKN